MAPSRSVGPTHVYPRRCSASKSVSSSFAGSTNGACTGTNLSIPAAPRPCRPTETPVTSTGIFEGRAKKVTSTTDLVRVEPLPARPRRLAFAIVGDVLGRQPSHTRGERRLRQHSRKRQGRRGTYSLRPEEALPHDAPQGQAVLAAWRARREGLEAADPTVAGRLQRGTRVGWVMRGTHSQDLPGVPATGKPFRIRASPLITLHPDRIREIVDILEPRRSKEPRRGQREAPRH